MCAKKFTLELPLKVILTEYGASQFISRKMKLVRFRLADNIEEYGIAFEEFTPKSLQNMIRLDYISKLEISMSEFVSKRQEIMDLSKLVVYSVLYKQFDKDIFTKMIESDCVRKYNRQNPANIIDERTNLDEKQLRQSMMGKGQAIQNVFKEILDPVWANVMNKQDSSTEEKNVGILMSQKFLEEMGLMNKYILCRFHKKDGFQQMINIIRQKLTEYMEKSKIAEFVSVMIMELALNCENTNMRKEARIMYQGVEDCDSLLFDPAVRSKIIQELQKKHEQVFISWKLGGGSTTIGKQGRLQITLYNKDDEFQEVKENIESKSAADTNKRSLIDFYREMPEGQEGTDLGLYYLSYLDEACKKVNVRFESLVNQYSGSDLTVINLVLNF